MPRWSLLIIAMLGMLPAVWFAARQVLTYLRSEAILEWSLVEVGPDDLSNMPEDTTEVVYGSPYPIPAIFVILFAVPFLISVYCMLPKPVGVNKTRAAAFAVSELFSAISDQLQVLTEFETLGVRDEHAIFAVRYSDYSARRLLVGCTSIPELSESGARIRHQFTQNEGVKKQKFDDRIMKRIERLPIQPPDTYEIETDATHAASLISDAFIEGYGPDSHKKIVVELNRFEPKDKSRYSHARAAMS